MKTLASIYEEYACLTDKGTTHSYIEVYEQLLADYRTRPITLIEIGVNQGGSIALWNEYFSNAATRIVGIDIQDVSIQVSKLVKQNMRVSTVCGDATDVALLGRQPSADIVIDDGSHDPVDQLATFKNIFPRLNKNGIYLIEDVGGGRNLAILLSYYRRFQVFDRRPIKNRWDDIVLVARNPEWTPPKRFSRLRDRSV